MARLRRAAWPLLRPASISRPSSGNAASAARPTISFSASLAMLIGASLPRRAGRRARPRQGDEAQVGARAAGTPIADRPPPREPERDLQRIEREALAGEFHARLLGGPVGEEAPHTPLRRQGGQRGLLLAGHAEVGQPVDLAAQPIGAVLDLKVDADFAGGADGHHRIGAGMGEVEAEVVARDKGLAVRADLDRHVPGAQPQVGGEARAQVAARTDEPAAVAFEHELRGARALLVAQPAPGGFDGDVLVAIEAALADVDGDAVHALPRAPLARASISSAKASAWAPRTISRWLQSTVERAILATSIRPSHPRW